MSISVFVALHQKQGDAKRQTLRHRVIVELHHENFGGNPNTSLSQRSMRQ